MIRIKLYSNVDNNGTISEVGELYQDDLYDPITGEFKGTHQGFSFNFNNGTQFDNNDILVLNDGTINFIDDYIITATDNWSMYQGGTMPNWIVTSYDPYSANISMIEPTVESTSEEDSDGDDQSSNIYFRTLELHQYQQMVIKLVRYFKIQ